MNKELLSFINNEALYKIVRDVLKVSQRANVDAEKELHKNVVDPFSALFDALRQNITLDQWLEQEKARQSQKTLQNALGDFHQNVLGSMTGWENLGKGQVVDLRNTEKKIIAEVKNKFNTTKGNHKVRIYDDFESLIGGAYAGNTAYYVEVIPKSAVRYDKPFTPSDNQTSTRRAENAKIRVIDGYSFYDLATGEKDALKKLYAVLPIVITEVLGSSLIEDKNFMSLFVRAYGA